MTRFWKTIYHKSNMKTVSLQCESACDFLNSQIVKTIYHRWNMKNGFPSVRIRMWRFTFNFDWLFVAIRSTKWHIKIKSVYNSKTKNNFFHDRRLDGTCNGYLVKLPLTMHLVAQKSFRSIWSYCFERDETILVKILVHVVKKELL